MESAKERMLALRRWKEEQQRKLEDEEIKKREAAEAQRKAEEEALRLQKAAEKAAREAAAKAKEDKKEADKKAKLEFEAALVVAAEAKRQEDLLFAKEIAVETFEKSKSKPKRAAKTREPTSSTGVVEREKKA